jgi:hypothetical protein
MASARLSLYLINVAFHEDGGVEVQLHGILTSELDGSQWLDSRPRRFIPGERASQ